LRAHCRTRRPEHRNVGTFHVGAPASRGLAAIDHKCNRFGVIAAQLAQQIAELGKISIARCQERA
jgi:hypothetical protein